MAIFKVQQHNSCIFWIYILVRSVAQMAALAAQAASVNFNQEDAPCSNLNVDDPMLWGAAFPCEFMPNSEGTGYPSAYNTKMIRKRKPHEDSLMNIATTEKNYATLK